MSGVTAFGVLAFGAEVAVYAAAGWWAWRRPGRRSVRLLVAVVAVAGLAVLWGQFAAPTADRPLHGPVRVAFELCWFGAGVAAAVRAGVARSRMRRGRGRPEEEPDGRRSG
ncbi:YrdB family protein [Kitasatospora sp. DSM 101779]|uniref:YrdB family protein n=1 Tax=Kitasatospora sp. DSM 101779 TaxID=2853165 RepID=UPI0021D7D59E|nr:YrdB family protein [Kitasatospora sp. DSM 101779]MCU7827044.1 YrdB family protein [Kitasatospora sp. DSM 101779]